MNSPMPAIILVFISLSMILRMWNKHRKGLSLSRFEKVTGIITTVCAVGSFTLEVIPHITNYQPFIPTPISWGVFIVSVFVLIVIAIFRLKRWMSIEYIEGIQAYVFFPKGTPLEKRRDLEYHRKYLHHRLIVNLKTKPPKAYYMNPKSYGWKFIKKHDRWVHEVVTRENYSCDDPDFTEKWCKEKGYELYPSAASKNNLLETENDK